MAHEIYSVLSEGKHTVKVVDQDGLTFFTLNPKAFVNQQDAIALAEHLAKFMTQMRMWSN